MDVFYCFYRPLNNIVKLYQVNPSVNDQFTPSLNDWIKPLNQFISNACTEQFNKSRLRRPARYFCTLRNRNKGNPYAFTDEFVLRLFV
jgi:hypothetical protein